MIRAERTKHNQHRDDDNMTSMGMRTTQPEQEQQQTNQHGKLTTWPSWRLQHDQHWDNNNTNIMDTNNKISTKTMTTWPSWRQQQYNQHKIMKLNPRQGWQQDNHHMYNDNTTNTKTPRTWPEHKNYDEITRSEQERNNTTNNKTNSTRRTTKWPEQKG